MTKEILAFGLIIGTCVLAGVVMDRNWSPLRQLCSCKTLNISFLYKRGVLFCNILIRVRHLKAVCAYYTYLFVFVSPQS